MKRTLISVLTYNRFQLLNRCIDKIIDQTYWLLIINNGSDNEKST